MIIPRAKRINPGVTLESTISKTKRINEGVTLDNAIRIKRFFFKAILQNYKIMQNNDENWKIYANLAYTFPGYCYLKTANR